MRGLGPQHVVTAEDIGTVTAKDGGNWVHSSSLSF